MKRSIQPLLLIILLMISSCHGGDSRPDRKLLIPDDRLVEILTDTYLTSGMLDLGSVRDTWGKRDSILNYTDVIESHGFTYEQMEATMSYYFNSKPKKLIKIYDRVTGKLLELEARLSNDTMDLDAPADGNLWTGKLVYNFPADLTRDPIWFDMAADSAGVYSVKADIILFRDDQSINPRVTVFFSTVDSLGNETRDYWNEVPLLKNDQVQHIEISKPLKNPDGVRLKGWLLNHDSQVGNWEKHARVNNINISVDRDDLKEEK